MKFKKDYEEINCLVCKSKNYEILIKKKQYNENIYFSICKTCGFVYLNPRWTKKKYSLFYETEYDKYFNRSPNKKNIEIKNYLTILKRLKIQDKHNLNILDIGCGMGDGLNYLKKYFKKSKFFAIETSILGIENLKKNDIKILSNNVDKNWNKKSQKYDLIILRHVLEHLSNPKNTLKKIHESLSENGRLYVSVPALEKSKPPISKGFLRLAHTSYYSLKKLKYIITLMRFEILDSNYSKDGKEIYIICKKSNKNNKLINENEYLERKKEINSKLKKEKEKLFILKWKIKIIKNKIISLIIKKMK